jgi:hypothetical protein
VFFTRTTTLTLSHAQFSTICGVAGYRDSGTDHYESLISHLRGLKGNAILGHQPGGRWCFRYSCQNNIGVYACNDNEFHDVHVPWSLLVEYAGYIHGSCTIQRKIKGVWTERVLGQAFHPHGWNVIVGISTEEGC